MVQYTNFKLGGVYYVVCLLKMNNQTFLIYIYIQGVRCASLSVLLKQREKTPTMWVSGEDIGQISYPITKKRDKMWFASHCSSYYFRPPQNCLPCAILLACCTQSACSALNPQLLQCCPTWGLHYPFSSSAYLHLANLYLQIYRQV